MKPARLVALAAAVLSLSACAGSVMPLYQQARDDALADPGPPPADWKPDAVLHLSKTQLDEVVTAALESHGALTGRIKRSVLGLEIVATPDLTIDELTLGASKACKACVAVDTKLSGDVQWTAAGRKGKVPVKVAAAFDVELSATEAEASTFAMTAAPRELRDLKLTFGSVDATVARVLEQGVGDWLREDFLKDVPPVEIGAFGGEDVPLRAVRIAGSGGGVRLEMLTRSPSPGVVDTKAPAGLDEGFQLAISQDSLLDLARATAFQAGPLGYDVVVEPTALTLTEDGFTMGLRVWRPVGKGWWRDYTVTGDVEMARRGVKLLPQSVTEGAKSEGAGLADPLALLAEGYMLKTIEESIATTLPTKQTARAGDVRTDIAVRSIAGVGDAVVVSGVLDVREPAEKPSGSRAGAKERP